MKEGGADSVLEMLWLMMDENVTFPFLQVWNVKRMERVFENYLLFNTLFSLAPKYRPEAAVIINNELALFKKPIILTGDINGI